ncbi:Tenascin major-like isoform X1 [Hyalella azteca]|uniref:Tenascin major-like isoform X1 n=1 Tax=Hyalella azteca TaxID=294128 RepID=A0A6A0GWD2_HYAAZ|nr:Tenascin major-like isoform X1 [Hyalella azteca]
MTGWNGRHCTLSGCPSACSGHGTCVLKDEEWHCVCHQLYEGLDCATRLESECQDGQDNDQDGLTDCEDSECCTVSPCDRSNHCYSSHDPIDILLRKQPPAVTASFFQKMRFIVEEGSLQTYAKQAAFNQSATGTGLIITLYFTLSFSRASVVRGRVISGQGSGLLGVRVSMFRPNDTGFTLTRHGGRFDLMVNGGGAVKLVFGKPPFRPYVKTVRVPWNEVVVIDTIVMTTTSIVPPPPATPCLDHDYDKLKPVVLATWKHGFQGGCPERSAILAESQVIQESLPIPGSGLHLVYHSSRSIGYESTIQLQLTPDKIPATLRLIHLRITIEGILFEKTFEADADIKFTYAWDRLNVYRQRVYGVTWAVVRVGYAYSNCDRVIWEAQTTQVSGHEMSISDIGGWDLSIHHRYNFHEGILQKGDGRNIYLKQRPRVLRTLMGDGRQREVNCKNCDDDAINQRLLTPADLTAAPDGSLYVADFNLIRRILPDNTVRTVVKLNETRVSYRYHLAVSPTSGTVYISDPEAHQILKVKNPDDFSNPENNYMPFVGSGKRCLPGDDIGCGDGGRARDAKLQYPKGMAVSSEEVVYFADGTNVRAVDSDGIISTVIGTHRHRSHWQPLPCSGTLPVDDISLRWPTSLAVNPLDESLYVLDDHHVLRLTHDRRIKVVAGRPLHCPPQGPDSPSDLATHTTLRSPQSLAFASNGDLYIAESDTERLNRVRVIVTDGLISDFAGAESKCNCREDSCSCFDDSHVLAANAIFSTISAVAVTPDGVVHVMDQGNLRVRSVTSSLPQPTQQRLYEIYSPESQEIYVFNRFGHHIETRNIPTGRTLYSFVYNVNTSNGKLSSVTDGAGNRVSFLRDYTGQVTMVENSRQQKCLLNMSRMRRLERMVTPDDHNITLTYHGATGLLRSSMDSVGRAHVYSYDNYGRLIRAVTPSGQLIELTFDLSIRGARVTVSRDGGSPITMLINGAKVTETIGDASSVTALLPDGTVVTKSPWDHHIATETTPYPLIDTPTIANSFPVPGRQRTEIGQELVNSFEWRYFVERSRLGEIVKQLSLVLLLRTQVGRHMRVNGEDVLTFKYDMTSATEAVMNPIDVQLLNVTYDSLGRPLRWTLAGPFASMQITYDRFGQVEQRVWGHHKESYAYDKDGRLEIITYADGTKKEFSYLDDRRVKPFKMSINGGNAHYMEHDIGEALSSITTPKGHKYLFRLQPSVLHNRFVFSPPIMPRHYYQLLYSDEGRLLAEVLPLQAGRVVYNYDEAGRLQFQIYGDGSTEYGYQPETGLLRSVTVRELGYEQRIENKYHAGLVKEQRIRFGPADTLHSVKARYLYDGYARPRRVEMEIDGSQIANYETSYDVTLGTLETVQELKFTKTYHNKTMVQDSRKTYVRVSSFDAYGRKIESSITVRGRLVHRSRYSYDARNRVTSHSIWRGPGTSETSTNYTYTPVGHLETVEGSKSWQFRYDENGNMIAVIESGHTVLAEYDEADRLTNWEGAPLNVYDSAGRLLQQNDMQYSFTARGNVRHVWREGVFLTTHRHDHKGRLVAWQDNKGNSTQFFYTNLKQPDLPTHIHDPVSRDTTLMLYDEQGHLIGMQTERAKFWVAADNVGSPIAIFDASGVLMKEIKRSPWGAIIEDTRPDLLLPVDFQGGIRDPITGMIIFGLNMYDPFHGQWLSPRFDRIAGASRDPSSVYLHRFANNDPVNPMHLIDASPKNLNRWLKMFGVDLGSMLGSKYHDETLGRCVDGHTPAVLKPALSVISGLSCSTKGIVEEFSRPSLVPKSAIKTDELITSDSLTPFSSAGPVLGPGVMVSSHAGRALITLVPSRENSVVQGVARDVLNGSALLELTLPHHRHHTLYLVKEDVSSRPDDLQQLQRLSGLFNVSVHEGQHPELRVTGGAASLVILYGSSATAARHRLLRHVQRRAAEHAWAAEVERVKRGGPVLHPWTEEEKQELLRTGEVSGYAASELHPVHRFPLLADDASNVVFRHSGRRRRRARSHPTS